MGVPEGLDPTSESGRLPKPNEIDLAFVVQVGPTLEPRRRECRGDRMPLKGAVIGNCGVGHRLCRLRAAPATRLVIPMPKYRSALRAHFMLAPRGWTPFQTGGYPLCFGFVIRALLKPDSRRVLLAH